MARTKSGIVYHAPKEHGWRDEEGYITIDTALPGGESAIYDVSLRMYNPMNFERFAEVSERDRLAGLPHGGSSIEIMAILDGAARAGNSEDAVRAREFLRQGLQRWPWTLSQIVLQPERAEEPDRFIHNFGSENQYAVEGDFAGDSFDVENLELDEERVLRAGFGRYGVKRVNGTSQKINGTNSHLWRNNRNSEKEIVRGVGFVALSDRLDLNCNWFLRDDWSAFRVMRVE